MAEEFDVVILGGGTGGYVAAIRASQLGLKTAIVEKEKIGGTCLHKGCIPSKALLRSAEVLRQTRQSEEYGVLSENTMLDFSSVQRRKQKIVNTLYKGVQGLMEKGQVDVYKGFGRLLGPSIFSPSAGTISVESENKKEENTLLLSKNVILATGSSPRQLKGLESDGKMILTSDEALMMEELPASMLIIGGGVIGIEWASMLNDFGVDVTILEYADHILPTEDADIAREMTRLLKKRGIKVITSANVLPDTIKIDDTVQLKAEVKGTKNAYAAEKVLVSVGRSPNITDIGLENTDIGINEQGAIEVNDFYQTKESHIYAIGDVIGGIQLAHMASREGITAIEHIGGRKPEKISYNSVPSCIYSFPEAARVGLTEKQAKEQGYEIQTGNVSFKAIGKALIYGENDGFVKIISDNKTNDLLGIHMIGPHVTELVSEAGIAMVLDATPWEIAETVHPHPSLSEAIGEAAMAVEGRKIHG